MDEQYRVYVKNLVHIFEKKRLQKQSETSQTDHAIRIQSKFSVITSLMGRTGDVASILHRENHLSDQERAAIVALLPARLRANETLLDLLKTKPRAAYRAFLDALNETNQQHLVRVLVFDAEKRSRRDLDPSSSVDDGDRPVARRNRPAHAVLIGRLYDWLTDSLRADEGLVAALHRDGVLTERERGLIDGEANRVRRNQLLLAIVSQKTDDEFHRFLNGLEETNQVKVVDRFKGADVTDQEHIHFCSSPVLRASKTQPHTRVAPTAIPVFTRSPSIRKAQCSKAQRSMSLETTGRQASESDGQGCPSPTARDAKLEETGRLAPKAAQRNTGRTKTLPRQSLPVGEENAAGSTGLGGVITRSSLQVDDVLDRLQSSLKVNDELRFQLRSARTNQRLLEAELQKLRTEHQECRPSSNRSNDSDFDCQRKKLRAELSEEKTVVRTKEPDDNCSKDDLEQTRIRLANEVEINRRRETLLIESSAKIRELLEKTEDLEKRLRQARNENDKDAKVEELQDISKEKQASSGQAEPLLRTPGEEIQLLEKDNPGRRDITSSPRSQLEDLERRGGEEFSEMERRKQKSESDANETVKDELLSKSISEKIIGELEAALAAAKEEISNLRRQLEDKGRQETRRPSDDDDDDDDDDGKMNQLLEVNAVGSEANGGARERPKDEEIKNQILEHVQIQLEEALRLGDTQHKDQEDLRETSRTISARLNEAECGLRDKNCEIDKLTSEICEEKRLRESAERALNEAQETILALRRNELDARGISQERSDALLARLNEEISLRKEADRNLAAAGEELALQKQRRLDQEALLCKANRDIEMLGQRLSEAGVDAQRRLALEKRLTEANEQNASLSKQVDEQKRLLQNADKDRRGLTARIDEMGSETDVANSSLERRLQEAQQNMERLKQHSDNQEALLQQIGAERNVLVEKLAQLDSENRTRRELTELLETANEEISSLRKQKNAILERQRSDAEQVAFKIQQDREEHRNLEKGLDEYERQINQLLKDVSHERLLKFEQQRKLDEAKGTIAHLTQQLEAAAVAENYSKPGTEYSSTASPPPHDDASNELSAATQQQQQQQQHQQKLDELSKELKEKESELWKVKKELAKERLQNRKNSNMEQCLAAAACEHRHELNAVTCLSGRKERGTPSAEQQIPCRKACPRIIPGSCSSDPSQNRAGSTVAVVGGGDDDYLGLANSGPPLNLRIFVDRPKRKKNHAVKSSAGFLAREVPGPAADDGGQEEEEEPGLPSAPSRPLPEGGLLDGPVESVVQSDAVL